MFAQESLRSLQRSTIKRVPTFVSGTRQKETRFSATYPVANVANTAATIAATIAATVAAIVAATIATIAAIATLSELEGKVEGVDKIDASRPLVRCPLGTFNPSLVQTFKLARLL